MFRLRNTLVHQNDSTVAKALIAFCSSPMNAPEQLGKCLQRTINAISCIVGLVLIVWSFVKMLAVLRFLIFCRLYIPEIQTVCNYSVSAAMVSSILFAFDRCIRIYLHLLQHFRRANDIMPSSPTICRSRIILHFSKAIK